VLENSPVMFPDGGKDCVGKFDQVFEDFTNPERKALVDALLAAIPESERNSLLGWVQVRDGVGGCGSVRYPWISRAIARAAASRGGIGRDSVAKVVKDIATTGSAKGILL
jgi:hypothetical protein